MRKAVAIPYIIALVLGVIIIALVGYFLFGQFGKTSTVGKDAECQSKLLQYCMKWISNDRTCSDSTRPDPKILEGCPSGPLRADCQEVNVGCPA